MDISTNGLKLIIEFEGFGAKLYNDPSGNCTIGYGYLVHLGKCDGRPSEQTFTNGITKQQGEELLHATVTSYVNAVNYYTKVPLNQNQFDALVSLCYNIGAKGYANSGVLGVLNQGRYDLVCTELLKIIHGSDGIVYPGLVRRRQAECNLFNTPDEETMASAEYNELKGLIGSLLAQEGALGSKLDASNKEGLIRDWLIANGKIDEAKARMKYVAIAANIQLP